MAKIQAIRGMNDLLPQQSPVWQYLEHQIKQVLSAYGYREIRMPIVEQTELFKRSIGEVTDIGDVRTDDEVVLLGRDGDECISAEQIARWSNTINYEVTTRINDRIPRIITD